MRPFLHLLLTVGLLPCFASAEDLYVPDLNAPTTLAGAPVGSIWFTNRLVLNPTDQPLAYKFHTRFGWDGASPPPHGCDAEFYVPPRSSVPISTPMSGQCISPGAGVGFLQLHLQHGLLLNASIELLELTGCGPESHAPVLASGALPVYSAPFPAGSVVVIDGLLPPPPEPDVPCIRGAGPDSRRVNVTIVNLGSETTFATVSLHGGGVAPLDVVLPPGHVRQLNDVFHDSIITALSVSASQPFLCYASAVSTFTDPHRPASVATYPFRPLP
jgi:hypothetical protein